MIPIQISASSVAWYGAIVATAGFVLSMYSILRDKPKVYVDFRKNIYVKGEQAIYDPQKAYFNITALNRGRRPIRIEKAAVKEVDKRGVYLLGDSFAQYRNHVLTEENPRTEFLIEQEQLSLDKLLYVAVYDATGREFKKYTRKFPTFFRVWYWIKPIICKS